LINESNSGKTQRQKVKFTKKDGHVGHIGHILTPDKGTSFISNRKEEYMKHTQHTQHTQTYIDSFDFMVKDKSKTYDYTTIKEALGKVLPVIFSYTEV
jgi:hypothetical protein